MMPVLLECYRHHRKEVSVFQYSKIITLKRRDIVFHDTHVLICEKVFHIHYCTPTATDFGNWRRICKCTHIPHAESRTRKANIGWGSILDRWDNHLLNILNQNSVYTEPLQKQRNIISTITNFFEAGILALTAPPGSLTAGIVMELYGRKTALQLASIIFIEGWIIVFLAHTVPIIYIGRIITGFAAGIQVKFDGLMDFCANKNDNFQESVLKTSSTYLLAQSENAL